MPNRESYFKEIGKEIAKDIHVRGILGGTVLFIHHFFHRVVNAEETAIIMTIVISGAGGMAFTFRWIVHHKKRKKKSGQKYYTVNF